MIDERYLIASIEQFVGRELGVSEWIVVTQDMINNFAETTGDRQWIHVDVERARRESPFGGPIAHGYLTLSLVAGMSQSPARCRKTLWRHSIMVWIRSVFRRQLRLAQKFVARWCWLKSSIREKAVRSSR
jgi:hypothetical protein